MEAETRKEPAKRVQLPLTEEVIRELKAGDVVLLCGVLYSARDAAHQRMEEALDRGEALPFAIQGQTIYYVGPTPEKPGQVFGSAGPTSSCRMDAYTVRLLELGLKGMIGKGSRSPAVNAAIKQHGAVYFGAIGGLGAIMGKSVKAAQIVAYQELGAEAIRRLLVEDLPVTVLTDSQGGDLYRLGQSAYLKWREEHESD